MKPEYEKNMKKAYYPVVQLVKGILELPKCSFNKTPTNKVEYSEFWRCNI